MVGIKKNPRMILNELKWRDGFTLNKAEVWYLHRGAPHDTKIITGVDILNIEKSFMKTTTAMIPYHRILKIIYNGEILFERKK